MVLVKAANVDDAAHRRGFPTQDNSEIVRIMDEFIDSSSLYLKVHVKGLLRSILYYSIQLFTYMKNIIGCLLLFVYFQQIGIAETMPSISHQKATITVDGQLTEDIWNTLPAFPDFHNHYPIDSGLASKKTIVKAFHDGNVLYIGAIYQDESVDDRVSSLKRDNFQDSFNLSDAFGLAIDPYNEKNNGYFFGVNIGETQIDGLISNNENINDSWSNIWYAKTSMKGNQKIFEMAIPFRILNFDPNNSTWGIQFFTKDGKTNTSMTLSDIERNFRYYDLRYLTDINIEQLPQQSKGGRLTLIPSVTASYQKDVVEEDQQRMLKPSLDMQYNLSSSLRLDATINPDFSQVDVDQQVANLDRFAINFPERRNFFLENSDLFAGLGPRQVNPLYSRLIGADSDLLFGLKLSGNVTPSTRIGILNVQSREEENVAAQNYGVLVGQQTITEGLITTGFLVNRQQTDGFKLVNDYNRVTGLNFTYRSKNKKWTAWSNYAKSFSNGVKGNNNFYNADAEYTTRKTIWYGRIRRVEKDYNTDIGFVPRLYNYDAINDEVVKNGYNSAFSSLQLFHYPKKAKYIDSYRYLLLNNGVFFNTEGTLTDLNTFINNAMWFKNLSAIYLNFFHSYANLQYAFDPLGNDNPILPGKYQIATFRFGYKSSPNKKLYTHSSIQYGAYYTGNRYRSFVELGYRMLPLASINASYEINRINLHELGKNTLHLLNFKGEVFFSNTLNWTSYVQYNTQNNKFNFNTRLQWEYRPLSYVYLVFTDSYNKQLDRQNWGVALKVNYRLNI